MYVYCISIYLCEYKTETVATSYLPDINQVTHVYFLKCGQHCGSVLCLIKNISL